MEKPLKVEVTTLAIDAKTKTPCVILKAKDEKEEVPIWIGAFEANSIASKLEKIERDRPLTHDLLQDTISILGAKLERVEIHDLIQNTYYSRLILNQGGKEIRLDARPSDAIALALRMKCPIFMEEEVYRDSSMKMEVQEIGKFPQDREGWEEFLKNLSDDAFGKYRM